MSTKTGFYVTYLHARAERADDLARELADVKEQLEEVQRDRYLIRDPEVRRLAWLLSELRENAEANAELIAGTLNAVARITATASAAQQGRRVG